MKKIWGYFLKFLVLGLILLIQNSFLSPLIFIGDKINLMVVFLVFIVFREKYRLALYYAFIGGLMAELFTAYSAGVTSVSLVLTTVLLTSLAEKFFTNRSVLSLVALMIFGTVIHYALWSVAVVLSSIFHWGDFLILSGLITWLGIISQIGGNLIMILLCYLVIRMVAIYWRSPWR